MAKGQAGAVPGSLAAEFQYAGTQRRAADVLDVLAVVGPIESPEGRAVGVLAEHCAELGVELKGNGHQQQLSQLTLLLARLEAHGWAERSLNGRRTYRVALGAVWPVDHAPGQSRTDGQRGPVPELAAVDAEPEPIPSPGELDAARGRHPASLGRLFPVEPVDDDDEAAAIGGRPGRFAARIERTLPALVETAVNAAIDVRLRAAATYAAGLLGLTPHDDAERLRAELADARRELDRGAETLAILNDELRAERNAGDAARAELNRLTARTEKATGGTVRVSELPENTRAVATEAVNDGWSIHRTNGGHFVFRHLHARTPVFTSASPSDWRTPRNLKRDLDAARRNA